MAVKQEVLEHLRALKDALINDIYDWPLDKWLKAHNDFQNIEALFKRQCPITPPRVIIDHDDKNRDSRKYFNELRSGYDLKEFLK